VRLGIVSALIVAGVLVVGTPAVSAGGVELTPIPAPSLEGMDETVKEQLGRGLAALEAMADDPAVDAAELGEAYGEMGRIYLAYDLVGPAAACFENARTLDPGDFRWPYLLGSVHQGERRLAASAAALEAALELDPGYPPALLRLGNVRLVAGEHDAARQAFERVLEHDPESAPAHAGLAKVAAAGGDPASAARHFEAALERQPQASALRYPLALAYRELGRVEEARRQLAERGDVEVSVEDPLIQGLLQLATGAGVQLMFGNRAVRKGQLEKGLEHYRQALELDPRSPEVHRAVGNALTRRGDRPGAIRAYSQALALRPDDPSLHYNLGTLLVERGDDEQAVRHFRAALDLAPDYANARFNLAAVLLRSGRAEEALGHYRRLLELEPDDRGTRFYAARALHEVGRHGEAAELLEGLVAEDPSRVPARLALAEVRSAQGDDGAARDLYARVLEIDGARPDERLAARRQLALLSARAGRYGEAAEQYREVVDARPGDADARFAEAMALLLGESYPEARERLEAAAAALPESGELRHLLARFLATCPQPALRDGERALEMATELFRGEQRPDYAETVAMAMAELGRFDDAAALQERLIREAERAGATGLLPRLRRQLEGYRRGEPSRAPWLG